MYSSSDNSLASPNSSCKLERANLLLPLVQHQSQCDDSGTQNDCSGTEEAQNEELGVGYHVLVIRKKMSKSTEAQAAKHSAMRQLLTPWQREVLGSSS